jgi:hypothetical protein
MMKRQPACQPLASAQSRRSASENTLRLPLTILAGSGNGLRQQLDTDKSDRLPARWLELLRILTKQATGSANRCQDHRIAAFASRRACGNRDREHNGKSHGGEPVVVDVGLRQPADTGGKDNRDKHLWVLACARLRRS